MRDEIFVSSLAEKYKVPIFLKKFPTKEFAAANRLSIQEAARKLRYDWFKEVLSSNQHNYLLTAHHADDNIETVLMNLFKGTGISGLRGIMPKAGQIVRPLLFARREEIKIYAHQNQLKWVHDSSNDDSKYTRNYFRHHIIPAIEKVFPEVINNIDQSIPRFREIEILYRQAVELHQRKLLQYKGAEIHIPVLKLLKTKPLSTIVFEVIKDYGFSSKQVNEVIKLLQSESGKYITSTTHRLLRNRKWLIISPLKMNNAEMIIIEDDQSSVIFDDCSLSAQMVKEPFSFSNHLHTAVLDVAQIQFPIILRKWKPGDYFYPLGMTKKKKLSRFFIDIKLSKGEKEHIWVLETNKKIIWVIGLRIDNRFKITASTHKAIRFEVSRI